MCKNQSVADTQNKKWNKVNEKIQCFQTIKFGYMMQSWKWRSCLCKCFLKSEAGAGRAAANDDEEDPHFGWHEALIEVLYSTSDSLTDLWI
jgi:hypothetical protein